MSGVSELRDGLKARLETIAGLTAHDVIPNTLEGSLPVAIVQPASGRYEQNFGNGQLTIHKFEVDLFVGMGDLPSAQDAMDRYLAASSTGGVYGAIHADRTLGGRAVTSFIRAYRKYEIRDFGSVDLLGVTLDIEVWSS